MSQHNAMLMFVVMLAYTDLSCRLLYQSTTHTVKYRAEYLIMTINAHVTGWCTYCTILWNVLECTPSAYIKKKSTTKQYAVLLRQQPHACPIHFLLHQEATMCEGPRLSRFAYMHSVKFAQ